MPPIRTDARASSKGTPERPAAATSRPQLGSPPCMAVFTSSEFAIVRAARSACAHSRAPIDANGDQLGGAFAAPDDADGELFRDGAQSGLERWIERVVDHHAARAVRHRKHRVVGRAFAVHGNRVERVARHRRQRLPQERRLHLRVARQKSQHRRHQRLDHPRALRHAADVERPRAGLDFHRRFLWKRIGRHDGQHRVAVCVAAERGKRLRDAVLHFLQVEIDADDAGRCDEHLFGTASE